MEVIDIIIIILLGVGAIGGYRKGIIMELVSIVALILGIFLGLKLLHLGINLLRSNFDISGQLLPYISFLIIFALVVIATNLVGKFVKSAIDMTMLSGFDRLGGLVFGALKWAFGISVLIWISDYILPDSNFLSNDSIMMSKIQPIAPWVVGYFTSFLPILDEIFKQEEEFTVLNTSVRKLKILIA